MGFLFNATNIYLKTELGSVILRDYKLRHLTSLRGQLQFAFSWVSHQQTTTDPFSSSCQTGEKMASFTSTFPILASPNRYEVTPSHPKLFTDILIRIKFPRLVSKPLLHF